MARDQIEAGGERNLHIPVDQVTLEGVLSIPAGATGVVVFIHGSGSSRFSRRNQFVARSLRTNGLGTLLFDLLTSEEGEVDIRTRELRFDIALLARRSIGVLDWLAQQGFANNLKTGLFGASTGAAAALIAAAERPEHVNAVVSRGGRPDLALDYLHRVETPTLLLVGSNDEPVIGMNQEAMNAMDSNTVSELRIIPGAGHLFEEPGALEEVAQYAGEWFIRYLPGSGAE